MTLTKQQLRNFRSQAHHLKPVLMVGEKGITENLTSELERVLEDHELIKVTIASADRDERKSLTQTLCKTSGALLIQTIGRISVLYRKSKKLSQ